MKTYLRHRIINVIDIKELMALEYLDLKGKYRDYSESHDFWELCYIQKGEFSLCIDNKEISNVERMKRNDVFTVYEGQWGGYARNKMPGWVVRTDISNLNEGSHVVAAAVYDEAGNEMSRKEVTIYV